MRSPISSPPDDARKGMPSPVSNGCFVSFAGAAMRFLRSPLQTLVQKSAHMIVVHGDAEVAPNQVGNALRGPKLIGPTVSLRTLAEHRFQLTLLLRRQTWGRARVRLGRKAIGVIGHAQPPIHGTFVDTAYAGNVLYAIALLDSFNSLVSTPFQFGSRSNRSTHVQLDDVN